MSYEDTIERCVICGEDFTKRIFRYPWKAQKKWVTHYSCPYCGKTWDIYLYGNEDVLTFRKGK
ncbi:MAG: hypothetical protein J6A47_03830 [Bacilli bacterium]|nr:hypothetical protein [Bacilli bacterium]